MGRDFAIHGPAMVSVCGGQHWSGDVIAGRTELGLTTENIKVSLTRYHEPVRVTDYGRKVPADVMWHLGDATITMKLVHVDPLVLKCCMSDSMGGGRVLTKEPVFGALLDVQPGFDLRPAGALLGNGLPRLASGNYFIGLNITRAQIGSPFVGDHWRFLTTYLAEQPVVYPLGTERSIVELTWKAIPYSPIWVDQSKITKKELQAINKGTNNNPEVADVTNKISMAVAQPGKDVQLVQDVFFALKNEIISSGVALWDNVPDPVRPDYVTVKKPVDLDP